MDKKKKESFWKKHNGKILLIILFLLILLLFSMLHRDFPFSKNFNPEIHVCEESCKDFMQPNENGMVELNPGDDDINKIFKCFDEGDSYCFKKRDKTPQELEIDYCNNNVDDSDKCKCQKTYYDFLKEQDGDDWMTFVEDYCIKATPKTEVEKLKDIGCEELLNDLIPREFCQRSWAIWTSKKGVNHCENLKQAFREKGCEI